MRANLDARLVTEFPELYRDRYAGMRDTCMCWGFECGDGWFEILHRLSARLAAYGVRAAQVKEKYGTLRFYFDGPAATFDEATAAVDAAELESARTCEICGQPGMISTGPWFVVRCDECAAK